MTHASLQIPAVEAPPPGVEEPEVAESATPVDGAVTVTFSGGEAIAAKAGQTLCEIAEREGLCINAECHSGLCGSDPVRVISGAENLSPIEQNERDTLDDICSLESGSTGSRVWPGSAGRWWWISSISRSARAAAAETAGALAAPKDCGAMMAACPAPKSKAGGPGRAWALLTVVAAAAWPGVALTQTVNSERLAVDAYITGLQAPTGMVFLADEDLLVIEKNTGRVRRARNGVIEATVLDLSVSTASERGGLGIELSPNFDDDGFVYIYYSAAAGGDGTGWTENVVARYQWNGSRLVSPTVLLRFPHRSGQANGPNHDGGTLRFGPDGNLYGQVGDLNRGRFDDPRIEQNTGGDASAEVGGIFRIDSTGDVPADNPFADHAVEAVRIWFVYGVRNGFGLAFDDLTDRLWFTENGPEVYDEINVAEPAMNSGWLPLMGPDSRDARYGANGNRAFSAADLQMLPGSVYRDPVVFSWLDPIGVTAMVFLRTDTFPCADCATDWW